jgi:hypothetical protein
MTGASNEGTTMNDYDPSELIAVCDSIIEDGEISGDELYALAVRKSFVLHSGFVVRCQ